MMRVTIHPYDASGQDRMNVMGVCRRSSFLGEPIDTIFRDTFWFSDFMVTPYLVLEPEYTWVARVDGKTIGYLTGSVSGPFGALRAEFALIKVLELYWKYLLGKYEAHPRSKRFAEFVFKEAIFQLPKHPKNTPHFHFNVEKDYRGMGVGRRLLRTFEDALCKIGKNRYYAEVMSSPSTRSEQDFMRLGYAIHDRVPTTVFYREVADLKVLCIVRTLRRNRPGSDICVRPIETRV